MEGTEKTLTMPGLLQTCTQISLLLLSCLSMGCTLYSVDFKVDEDLQPNAKRVKKRIKDRDKQQQLTEEEKRKPANIFHRDDRVSHKRILFPQWGSLHKKLTREKPWGTAFIVSPCHIGSAYHVVKDTKEEMTGKEVVYFDTPLRDRPIEATPVRWGTPFSTSDRELNAQDWVLLELAECFSIDEVSPLKLSAYRREELNHRELRLIGFPEDRHPDNITEDPECQFGPRPLPGDSGLGHDCSTRPGNSGSPLLMQGLGGEDEVVAIVVASRGYFDEVIVGYSDWIANRACPISPMAQALSEILEN